MQNTVNQRIKVYLVVHLLRLSMYHDLVILKDFLNFVILWLILYLKDT